MPKASTKRREVACLPIDISNFILRTSLRVLYSLNDTGIALYVNQVSRFNLPPVALAGSSFPMHDSMLALTAHLYPCKRKYRSCCLFLVDARVRRDCGTISPLLAIILCHYRVFLLTSQLITSILRG